MDPWGCAVYAAHKLTQGFSVPKSRRPKFTLSLKIVDIINVPLIAGVAYVKWQLPSSTSAEHSGTTDRSLLQDHVASWGYQKALPVRLTIDRNQQLHDCDIQFDIYQEFSAGSRADKVLLGNIKLNLAEYVEKGDSEEEIVRRYLMQNCKINATVKIGISMQQTEGENNFIAPPLKPATVFSGIAGVMSAEHNELNDTSRMPSIDSRSRENMDLQDMYRSTLAATWACQPGELPPDQLVENIFAGGDGVAPGYPHPKTEEDDDGDGVSFSDTDSRRTTRGGFSSGNRARSRDRMGFHSRNDSRQSDYSFGSSGKNRSESHMYGKSRGRKPRKNIQSDMDVREDLRSWEISWV